MGSLIDGSKFNYVICGSGGYYRVGYNDVNKLPNVNYFSSINDGISSSILLFLSRITFSRKANRVVKNPFSCFVYPAMFPQDFPEEKPLCFVVFGNLAYLYNSTYMDYIDKKYLGATKVLYIQDLVSRTPNLDINEAKEKFDLVLSYDRGDCEKYGLVYSPTPYSRVDVENDGSIPQTDVFFCGKAKNRYSTILKVYDACQEAGLTCAFFVTEIAEEMEKRAGIVYNQPMQYDMYLKYVVKSKCVLEVMQGDADGYTPRLWESIIYDKHLLTDNKEVLNSRFYNKDGIHFIGDFTEISEWIERKVAYPESLKDSLSPIALLKLIEKNCSGL